MDLCVSEKTSNASDDLIARDEFLGKNRSLRPSYRNEVDSEFGGETEVCLDHVVWSNLPEELLIHVFARVPVKNILQICSLSKSWRSTITSPQFQQAFYEASLVRISLMAETYERDTIFFSQANREESYRPSDNQRYSETVFEFPSDVAGTLNGLICVLKYEAERASSYLSSLKIFVMNLVTGIRRELPSPRITTERPTLVQMKANVGGFTISFIYTEDREDFQVTSWQVYDSVKNEWSNDADFNDVEIFYTSASEDFEVYYDVPATFHKETKTINIFNLHEGIDRERFDYWVHPSDPRGHVHNVSGELYKLCTREGRHGVWRLVCSSKWEMVCECPHLEGVWTSLRVMNDLVVLILELPVPYVGISKLYEEGEKFYEIYDFPRGGIVKVFHMPTKVWHSFPKDEHFTARFRYLNSCSLLDEYPFLVEIRFDSIP